MAAVARDFDLIGSGVFTSLATVFLVIADGALARGMSALLGSGSGHMI